MKPRDLEVFITGLARSGTSLLIMVFALNGKDIGYSHDRGRYCIENMKKRLTIEDREYHSSNYAYALRGGLEYMQDRPLLLRRSNVVVPYAIKCPYGTATRYKPKQELDRFSLKPKQVVATRRAIIPLINSRTETAIRRKKWPNLSKEEVRAKMEKAVPLQYAELERDFPNTIEVEFPKYVTDFDYLWGQIGHLLDEEKYEETKSAFEDLADLKLVRF